MKAAYLDCFSGISGNMFLGALLDAGLPEQVLREALDSLNLSGYQLLVKRVEKCGIRALHVDVEMTSRHHHRHLADIIKIIDKSKLNDAVKMRASAVFHRLAVAEAKVHGTSVDKVHFHEVGAVDAIVDIVGVVFAVDWLGITSMYASGLRTGKGFVKAAHGVMPIPAPATAELLHGIPWYAGDVEKELVTPTGAALVAELCNGFGDRPSGFREEITAYGAGTWELSIPNVVRLGVGRIQAENAPSCWLLETNIDDSTPEIMAYAVERLLAAGALDVWTTPIQMKKGRPGVQLSVLSAQGQVKDLERCLFEETSTIGIRRTSVERTIADRESISVKTMWGEVRMKVAYHEGLEVNAAPEYEDCRRISMEKDIPLKTVFQQTISDWRKTK